MPQITRNTGTTTTERMVVAIDLPENGLSGYLPRELAALPYLRRLGLWSNDIVGSIPAQIGQLSRLQVLHLDDNRLVGNIPRQIGRLKELADLSLDLNGGISGRIPPEIGNLDNLERLRLSNAGLQGPISRTIGRLAGLRELFLQNNRLARELPEELGELRLLEVLDVSGNEFIGGLPTSWSTGLSRLTRLEMQANELRFDMDSTRMCSLREDEDGIHTSGGGGGGGSGSLEVLVADCGGDDPKVTCGCCTACLP